MLRTSAQGKFEHFLQDQLEPDMTGESVRNIRDHVRNGVLSSHTAGRCPVLLQTNLVLVPKVYAGPLYIYSREIPKPCPLIDVGNAGDPLLTRLGADIDIRTDVPRCNDCRAGRLTDSPIDISADWTDDLAAFALGCSFAFERAFTASWVPMRRILERKTVPMFRT